jgi:hypothetical protein
MTTPRPLEYVKSTGGATTRPVWLTLTLVAFVVLTFFGLVPGLHNEHPFLVLWLIGAPVLTFIAVRLLPPRRAPALAPLLWLGLALLWALGGMATWQAKYGTDPHVLGRAYNRCSSNLERIGMHAIFYATVHAGGFPGRLDELLDELKPEDFIAPFTSDTPATGPTTRDVAAQLSAGGHCSYLYLGKGLTTAAPPGTVLAYEPLSNHQYNIRGVHVLYTDGTVFFIPERQAKRLIAELEAGHNPPRARSAP